MASVTKTFRFLKPAQIKRLHQLLISSQEPTQPNLLESAAHSPIDVRYYAQQENIFQLAAVLSENIAKNHAFQDGNKRTALLAADMFLKINGYQLQRVPIGDDGVNHGLSDAQVDVVTNAWSAEDLGRYYQSIATPIEA